MALLPPDYLNKTVALGSPLDNGGYHWLGTGFLYSHSTSQFGSQSQTFIFLVTNRHVAEASANLHVRFNGTEIAAPAIYPLPSSGSDVVMPWTFHAKADVAALMVKADQLEESGVLISCFRSDSHVIDRDAANSIGVSEGDGVFILGFPLGIAGENRNDVIVRHGVLSRIQAWLRNDQDEFWIDSSIYPGNSGGPVLTKPEMGAIEGTKVNRNCQLIGMVSSYLPFKDVAISTQTGRTRVTFEENSGLAVVVPVDQVHETVELAMADAHELLHSQEVN